MTTKDLPLVHTVAPGKLDEAPWSSTPSIVDVHPLIATSIYIPITVTEDPYLPKVKRHDSNI